MVDFSFTNPAQLWFLAVIPIMIVLHFYSLQYARKRALKFANFEALSRATGKTQAIPNNYLLLGLRLLLLLSIIFSAAGLTINYVGRANESDFVLVLDASASMAANDFTPNRFEAAKKAANEFIDALEPGSTQVGLVTFASVSQVHKELSSDLFGIKQSINLLAQEKSGGTAIGDAIITASNLFEQQFIQTSSSAKTIILLTDGRNNAGATLQEAINYASNRGVVIEVIGLGTSEGGNIADLQNAVSTIDQDALLTLARETKGDFVKANDPEALSQSFKELAKSKDRSLSTNLSIPLMLLVLLLLFIEWGLSITKYRIIP